MITFNIKLKVTQKRSPETLAFQISDKRIFCLNLNNYTQLSNKLRLLFCQLFTYFLTIMYLVTIFNTLSYFSIAQILCELQKIKLKHLLKK